MMADGCEQILDLAVILCRIANTIGCNHRQAKGTRNADGCLIPTFLFALPVALQFDVNIFVSEDACECFSGLAARCFATTSKRRSERSSSPPVRQIRPEAYWLRSSKFAAPSPLVVSRVLNCVMSWQRFW